MSFSAFSVKPIWRRSISAAFKILLGSALFAIPSSTIRGAEPWIASHIAAEAAGAEIVGAEDLVTKIQTENFFDFDVVIASPDMMGLVGRLGKVLGPKGLMPNPKAGTVTPDVAKAVTEAKAGKIEYRLDKTNIIHCPIGKVSFGQDKLLENLDTLMGAIVKARPAAIKGQYIKSCAVATTMGPGIKISTAKYGA